MTEKAETPRRKGGFWSVWVVASIVILLAGIVLALAFPFDEVVCSEVSVPGGAEVSSACPQPSHLSTQLWIVAAAAAVGVAILTVGYLRKRRG